jgi:spore coat polysaccharide biosynthesis protein SpsF
MQLGDLSIIHRIIYQAIRVASWFANHQDINVKPVLLIPKGDPLKEHVNHKITVFEGSEHDVLSRYVQAAEFFGADYIVRVTGDCPWANAQIISKCLRDAIRKEVDYCSNILVRTFIEGVDTEVLSRELLNWLDEEVKLMKDREHVTSKFVDMIRDGEELPFSIHTVMNNFDLSHIKTSIDTQAEYDEACHLFDDYDRKKFAAANYGSISI